MNGNPYFSVPDSYYLGRDVYAKNTIFSRCKTHCRLTAWIQKEFRAQTFAVNSINSRRIGTLLLSLLLLLLHGAEMFMPKNTIFSRCQTHCGIVGGNPQRISSTNVSGQLYQKWMKRGPFFFASDSHYCMGKLYFRDAKLIVKLKSGIHNEFQADCMCWSD
jgi:hypothetical protein